MELKYALAELGEELADEATRKAGQAERTSGAAAFQLVGEAKGLQYAAQQILLKLQEHA